jgi:hypothetical protein
MKKAASDLNHDLESLSQYVVRQHHSDDEEDYGLREIQEELEEDLNSPDPISGDMIQTTIECLSCYEKIPARETKSLKCLHAFCYACTTEYLKNCIN